MTKLCSFSPLLFLAILVSISVGTTMVPHVGACHVAVVGGGCPDVEACRVTCEPCYRGVGHVVAFCEPAGGGVPYESCVCEFTNGAPCPPPGPPRCPNPPSGAKLETPRV